MIGAGGERWVWRARKRGFIRAGSACRSGRAIPSTGKELCASQPQGLHELCSRPNPQSQNLDPIPTTQPPPTFFSDPSQERWRCPGTWPAGCPTTSGSLAREQCVLISTAAACAGAGAGAWAWHLGLDCVQWPGSTPGPPIARTAGPVHHPASGLRFHSQHLPTHHILPHRRAGTVPGLGASDRVSPRRRASPRRA